MPDSGHIPVLANEVSQLLQPSAAQVIVDLTAGRGGHALQLATLANGDATVVLFDLDQENLEFATKRIEAVGAKVHAFHANFVNAATSLATLHLRADCVLADLGFASNQMDDLERGLSFKGCGPLDMRLNTHSGRTAKDIIETYCEEDLANLIFSIWRRTLFETNCTKNCT